MCISMEKDPSQNHHRGQVAVEFLAVVAFFILITVPVFLYFYTSAPQKEYYASLSQAESSADEFVKYGELVGTQGNGTNITRLIVVPKYTQNITLNGTLAVIHVEYFDMGADVVRQGTMNFTPSVMQVGGGGTYAFVFENAGGNVNVTKK